MEKSMYIIDEQGLKFMCSENKPVQGIWTLVEDHEIKFIKPENHYRLVFRANTN